MSTRLHIAGILTVCALLIAGCASREEAAKPPAPAAPAPLTREDLLRDGRRLVQEGEFDSALAALERAHRMDTAWQAPLQDLALLRYDRALRAPEGSPVRRAEARRALVHYAALERLGRTDEETYEHLLETARLAGDSEAFLRHARTAARRHPSERRTYNLALALGEAGRNQEAVTALREAIGAYPGSGFQPGYHRLLGEAYQRMDRDQSAERAFADGVKIADRMLADGAMTAGGVDADRVRSDRTGMLRALKKLHQTYGRKKELDEVEHRLRAEGSGK